MAFKYSIKISLCICILDNSGIFILNMKRSTCQQDYKVDSYQTAVFAVKGKDRRDAANYNGMG